MKKKCNYLFAFTVVLLCIFLCACKKTNRKTHHSQSKISNDSILEEDTILNINDNEVFKHIKEKFVFSNNDSIPTIEYESKQEFKDLKNFIYSEWLDNDHLIILTSEYDKPNTFLIFNTKQRKIVDTIILTELFEFCGYLFSPTNIHGLSYNKDYFLFSCGGDGSGDYKLLSYDLNKRKIHNIEDYIKDKEIVYKKSKQLLHKDGRKFSFLPEIFSRYGQFSFTNNNGFEIAQGVFNFDENDSSQKYLTTIKFPPPQSIINEKNGIGFLPIVESDKMSEESIEKHLHFSNYYDLSLPLKIKDGKIYNAPRKNTMFGASKVIADKEAPFLFLPFTYYLNPKTLSPKFEIEKNNNFESVSSISNDMQARYTGLLVNNIETHELISVLVHGVGVQGLYKRKDNFMITSIFSDYGDNHLVVWDIKKNEPIARLNMERRTNHINGIFFDEKNKQIIGIHSNPAKIFVWNFYPDK